MDAPYGPHGDPAAHRARADLDAALAALPTAPRDRGEVLLIVSRRADGERETPEEVFLTVGGGVPGDSWTRRLPLNHEAQLTVMNGEVASLIANGQPLTHFGDNFFVTLDLTAGNQEVGTRWKLGDAVVEVSPKPHNGCKKFRERFGGDALAFVQDDATRAENRRGVYWKVVEPGRVAVGAPVAVVSRP